MMNSSNDNFIETMARELLPVLYHHIDNNNEDLF